MQKYRLLPHRHKTIKKVIHPDLSFLAFIMLFLIAVPANVFGQKTTSDDKDMSINATCYFFAYDMNFKDGSYAVGPTLSVGTNEKFWVQIGLLVDTRRYIFYTGGIMSPTRVEQKNLFVPFTFQYNYFNSDKIELYVTSGIIFSGRDLIEKTNRAVVTSFFNLTFGTGISYRPFSRLALRTYPSVRYNFESFSPGISVDISYLFSSKKWVEL